MRHGVHFSRGGTSTGAPAPLACILSLLASTSAAHFPPPSRLSEQIGPTRLWSRRMCIHLLPWELQNCKELLNNHLQENVGTWQKKDTPHPRAKEKPQQDGWRNKITFRIKPRGPHILTQTCLWVFECFQWRHGSAMAYHGDRGSGCSRSGSHSIWRRSPLAPP